MKKNKIKNDFHRTKETSTPNSNFRSCLLISILTISSFPAGSNHVSNRRGCFILFVWGVVWQVSLDLLKIFQQEQVHANLNKWKQTLLKIHAVLDDAEQKRETSKFVKIWLDEFEDLAYDVDDILDGFRTEALRRELNRPKTQQK